MSKSLVGQVGNLRSDWQSGLAECKPAQGRLPIAPQDAILPHMLRVAVSLILTCVTLSAQPGRTDRQAVDTAAADRGKRVYLQFCINCHGSKAHGTDDGPDLIRSVTVLHDRLGSEIGPALQKLPNHEAGLTQAQLVDLSHFLKQRVEETVKNRNTDQPPNVLTGDAGAGRVYFNGPGKCNTCHSATGDLAGIAKKYDPITLQQRFLFPREGRGGQAVQVTVTPASGAPVSGTLVRMDDFSVSLRDTTGEYRSWKRASELKVEVRDPYATHHELLDQYTDTGIHNVVAYLASLK